MGTRSTRRTGSKGMDNITNQGQMDPEKTIGVTQTGGSGVTPRKAKGGALSGGASKSERQSKGYTRTTGGAKGKK